MNRTATNARRRARSEPVALAGVVRTLLYAVLGTRLDARTLAELVFVAETVAGLLVRQLVSPATKRTARTKRPSTAEPALHAA